MKNKEENLFTGVDCLGRTNVFIFVDDDEKDVIRIIYTVHGVEYWKGNEGSFEWEPYIKTDWQNNITEWLGERTYEVKMG